MEYLNMYFIRPDSEQSFNKVLSDLQVSIVDQA